MLIHNFHYITFWYIANNYINGHKKRACGCKSHKPFDDIPEPTYGIHAGEKYKYPPEITNKHTAKKDLPISTTEPVVTALSHVHSYNERVEFDGQENHCDGITFGENPRDNPAHPTTLRLFEKLQGLNA